MKHKIVALAMLIASVICVAVMPNYVNAQSGAVTVGISPARESIVMNPGDSYRGSFKVYNPADSDETINYIANIKPFYLTENLDPVYTNENGNSEIAEWITITAGASGTLEPNGSAVVEYRIDVPETAPAGGQYAVIVPTVSTGSGADEGLAIGESIGVAYTILAEITGDSVSSGDILDAGLPGFLLDGKITGYSTIKNTGNVHGFAKYVMKVYPLFSDVPIYSNEEAPEEHFVLPDRQLYNESTWNDTPTMGIFNVSYTVEFQGVEREVTRMVIVCPWWILMIVVFGLLLLTLRIIALVKISRKQKAEKMAA